MKRQINQDSRRQAFNFNISSKKNNMEDEIKKLQEKVRKQ